MLRLYKFKSERIDVELELPDDPGFYWFTDEDLNAMEKPVFIPLDIWKIISVTF